MKRKNVTAVLIILCMLVSLLPASVSAAKINVITLSDITPSGLGSPLKFTPESSASGYSVTQAWSLGIDGSKMYTNSELYNQMLSRDGQLMDEADQVFRQGKTYMYMIMITPSSKSDFSENLTVKSGGRTLTKIDNENGDYMYAIGFYYDTKMHITAPNWKTDESHHWLSCADDNFVFEGIKQTHYFNRTTYACVACGYVTPEHMATKITKEPQSITAYCGDTVEFSVGATGANLEYFWKWGDNRHSLYNSDDYQGMKVSGCQTSTVRMENFNGTVAEEYKGIYCAVEGSRGSANTQVAEITAVHNKNVYEKTDGNGHKILCSCGKVMTESEPHTYVNNVCTKCGYRKGSTTTQFKYATLYAPDFAAGKSISDANATLKLVSDGIQGFRYASEWQFYSDPYYYPTVSGKFDENTFYRLKVYPVFENNYIMSEGATAVINYNGNDITCTLLNDGAKGYYFNIDVGKAPHNLKMTFEPNGGEGIQAPVYVDEDNIIYFPECTFTKADDEFFAWRFNGQLYSPDPEKLYTGCDISTDGTAAAVWKSQLTTDIVLTMDAFADGTDPNAVNFSSADPSKYTVTSKDWYVGDVADTTTKNFGKPLTADKDYTVQIVVKCTEENIGFAGHEDLNVTFNGAKITSFERRGSQQVVVTAKILNNVGVDFFAPADKAYLPYKTDMTKTSDKFDVEPLWFSAKNAQIKDRLSPFTKARFGKKYYLRLGFKNEIENQIFGCKSVKINGTAYPVSINNGSVITILDIPFIADEMHVNVSEDKQGNVYIESPQNMNVAFTAVLYDADKKITKVVTRPEFSLKRGGKQDSATSEINKFMPAESDFEYYFIFRSTDATVKFFVFENFDNLEPLCAPYNYKYNYFLQVNK